MYNCKSKIERLHWKTEVCEWEFFAGHCELKITPKLASFATNANVTMVTSLWLLQLLITNISSKSFEGCCKYYLQKNFIFKQQFYNTFRYWNIAKSEYIIQTYHEFLRHKCCSEISDIESFDIIFLHMPAVTYYIFNGKWCCTAAAVIIVKLPVLFSYGFISNVTCTCSKYLRNLCPFSYMIDSCWF